MGGQSAPDLPLSQQTFQLLETYDTGICVIFLVDFLLTLYRSPSRAQYFFKERGWLDLMGSIQNQGQLVSDVVRNRGQYATFVTLMLAMIVLSLASVFVLQFEVQSPEANITTGGDALWWAVVTITTVG